MKCLNDSNKKTKRIILKFLQETKSLTKFQLVKLVYIYDLACKQLEITSDTKLPFIWHHYGPYCEEIEKAILDLEIANKIEVEEIITNSGYPCFIHKAKTDRSPKLKNIENKVIRYIIKHYARLSYKELKDFVYHTAPMVKAQKRERFIKLNMNLKPELQEGVQDSPEIARVILEADLTDISDYIPGEKVMAKFKTILIK